MRRLSHLERTAIHATQHPFNAVAMGASVAAAFGWNNALPIPVYALSFVVCVLALWNRGTFRSMFDAEDRAAEQQEAAEQRRESVRLLGIALERLREHGYRKVHPVLREYEALLRIRDDIARLARDRKEVTLASEEEIVGRVDEMLDSYLKLAGQHVAFVTLLAGLRPGASTPASAVDRPIPTLAERFAELERRRQTLVARIAPLPPGAATRTSLETQLRAVDERVQTFEDAGRSHESVVSQLESIKITLAAIVERMSAAELVPADVSGYLDSAATRIADTRLSSGH